MRDKIRFLIVLLVSHHPDEFSNDKSMRAARRQSSNTNRFQAITDSLVADFQLRRPIRAGSLVISVFGDAIAPHGGSVWLGSLIKALEPFGINQRLVRTSVFRLAKDGWLESTQVGRRSFYSLTPEGRTRFHDASRRIYSSPRQEWDGSWNLVMLAGVDAASRDEIRKELAWLGFASFSSNVLAHPAPDLQSVEERLEHLDGRDQVLMMQATAIDSGERKQYLQQLVSKSWSLQELGARYEEFLDRFRPVYQAARSSKSPDPQTAFQLRTLLIHEYRKILLRDPFLPAELLPEQWNGVSAYQLCRNLYSIVAAPTEDFLTGALENADGPLPPASPLFYERFGGIQARG
jgi:phenylacetic acid degradation operon negative regulatory protein